MADDAAAAAQRRGVDAWRRALGAELIETHLSFVLIAGTQAFKIKKALDLGFADFRTLAQRRFFCEEELRLNRRTAPQLYRQVLPLTGTPDAPRLGGDGAPIDWVLCMRAFAQHDLWDRLAARGELGPAHVDALVDALCALHDAAAVAGAESAYGTPPQLRAPMTDNLRALAALCRDGAARDAVSQLRDWEAEAFPALHEAFVSRRAAGRVRESHGDLHLGNGTQLAGRPVLFDCLEFSAELRWTDVASDVAFMAMDLGAHGLPRLAHRFVNAWVEASGDAQALRVLRYYVVHRALVRAKVAALRAAQPGAAVDVARQDLQRYLHAAVQGSRRAAPVLMLTHGFSGSGKTAATQGLLEACGAIRLRADVERKRLFGLQPLQRVDAEAQAQLYSGRAARATQARLFERAELALRSGYAVILDATFLAREPRRQARALAERLGAGFVILHFDARPETLRARIVHRLRRADDASDADLAVLASQLQHAQPLQDDESDAVLRIDAEAELDDPAAPQRWWPLGPQLGRHGVSLQAAAGWQNRGSN